MIKKNNDEARSPLMLKKNSHQSESTRQAKPFASSIRNLGIITTENTTLDRQVTPVYYDRQAAGERPGTCKLIYEVDLSTGPLLLMLKVKCQNDTKSLLFSFKRLHDYFCLNYIGVAMGMEAPTKKCFLCVFLSANVHVKPCGATASSSNSFTLQ